MENQTTQEQDLSTFLDAFTEGLEPDEISTEPPATEGTEDADTQKDQGSSNTDANAGTPEKNTDVKDQSAQDTSKDKEVDKTKVEEVFTKSDRAFAELRTTNKAYGEGFMRLARLAKIDAKNPAQALELLSKHMDEIEANHGNITYAEVEKIRQQDKETADSKAQLQQEAYAGFERLKQMFKLDDRAILSFAEELKTQGINPFETPTDLVAQYHGLHFDELIAKAKEEGRQEELARRSKAQEHSTKPLTRTGGTKDTGESINSAEALRAFLEAK